MKTPPAPPRRLFDHILRCNTVLDEARYRPFAIAGKRVGSVREDHLDLIASFTDAIERDETGIRLAARLTTPEQRSAALTAVAKGLVEHKVIAKMRAENYVVVENWGMEPLALIDRSAVAVFGIQAFGVHLNGYTWRDDKLMIWIGKRALDKAVEPGKLDNMVAGGQPAGLSLIENLVKESEEEASVPQALARRARPSGAITYRMEGERGLKPDTMFVYDLELPEDFVPQPSDGEITEFMLMDPQAVIERLRTTYDFKFNVALVLIDFLIRMGAIRPENEPDYLALIAGLHRGV